MCRVLSPGLQGLLGSEGGVETSGMVSSGLVEGALAVSEAEPVGGAEAVFYGYVFIDFGVCIFF